MFNAKLKKMKAERAERERDRKKRKKGGEEQPTPEPEEEFHPPAALTVCSRVMEDINEFKVKFI